MNACRAVVNLAFPSRGAGTRMRCCMRVPRQLFLRLEWVIVRIQVGLSELNSIIQTDCLPVLLEEEALPRQWQYRTTCDNHTIIPELPVLVIETSARVVPTGYPSLNPGLKTLASLS